MISNLVKISLTKCHAVRNLSVSSFLNAKGSDPIQDLFINRIREYGEKSKKAENGLVDASQDTVRAYKDMIERIDRIYGAKEQDMLSFPKIEFKDDPLVDPRSAIPLTIPESRYREEVDRIIGEQEDVDNDIEIYQ